MSKSKLLRFQLAGIVGYGFLIDHAGIEQYSVSWPDRAAERFSLMEATSRGMIVEEVVLDASSDSTVDESEAVKALHLHYEQAIKNTVEGLQNEFAETLKIRDEHIKSLEEKLQLFSNPNVPPNPTDSNSNAPGPNTDETLTSFGLSANSLKALHAAGIETKSQVIEYLKKNGSLEPIPGIAARSEDAILKGLEIDKEALLASAAQG
ncbi:MAG: hypothetical protein U0930_04925 [Pirellulales bacterium]